MSSADNMAGATPANPERLRERLADLLGADRWVEADFPAVAPPTEDEVVRLLQGYPGELMIVGRGSSFSTDYGPPNDLLILLTSRLTTTFEHSAADQVVEIAAGWPVKETRERLAIAGVCVPALERFESGSIGGRLAMVSSRHSGGLDGWTQSLLAMRVALPDGEILNFGSHCMKDVAGYDLRHLFTGSRGAVGVILRAAFRCRPRSEWTSPVQALPARMPGRYSPALRKILDPKGRMRSGA